MGDDVKTDPINELKVILPEWWTGLKGLEFPMILLDNESNILDINPECTKLLGYQIEQIQDNTILDITADEDRQREAKNIIDIFFSHQHGSWITKNILTQSNQLVRVDQITVAFRNPVNDLEYALVTFTVRNSFNEKELSGKLQKLLSSAELFDQDDIGSHYNHEIIKAIKSLINEIHTFLLNQRVGILEEMEKRSQ